MDHSRYFPCHCSGSRPDLPLTEALRVTGVIVLPILKALLTRTRTHSAESPFWLGHF